MNKKPWFFGKNILISGASSGIGYNLSKLLATMGGNVMGLARRVERLEQAKVEIDEAISNSRSKSGSFNYEVFDVTGSWQDLKARLDQRGFKVEILVNNAGIILPFDKFENESLDDLKRVFDTNFFSQIQAYQTFKGDLKAAQGGLVNISSSSALCPVVGQAVYSASKVAVLSFTDSIRVEHKNDFYVAVVCPGYTRTELFREQHTSKLVNKISMPAEKMAKKIVRGIKKKKGRMVFGTDAHLMSGMYRMFPKSTPKLVYNVLKKSKDEMFNKI